MKHCEFPTALPCPLEAVEGTPYCESHNWLNVVAEMVYPLEEDEVQ